MQHSPGFLKLVEEAQPRVKELNPKQAQERLDKNPRVILLDVREDHEWLGGHIAEAEHLGKGIIERDLEQRFPDTDAEILMYCGGGYRSILTCDAAQKMGYPNVYSISGGYKGLLAAGWTTAQG
ncbi:MAG: sulfurtransferase [Verrucomicrobiales bacterium]|nr:sulfurtransferase [Verrucomicrobiales bacterium]